MTNNVKISISGGLHGAPVKNFIVTEEQAEALLSGQAMLFEVLTKYQMESADKHICNVKYCQCAKAHHKGVIVKLFVPSGEKRQAIAKTYTRKPSYQVTDTITGEKRPFYTFKTATKYVLSQDNPCTIEKL